MTLGHHPRLRVLVSAYACEPHRGSEPAVGWNLAMAMVREHDVWVITRANNREKIESALAQLPSPRPNFAYVDLPAWARFWKRGPAGVTLYYYLWQFLAYRAARTLHREIRFDLTHHITFVKYSVPSLLVRIPVPFVWGPVGGGESAPRSFVNEFSWRGRVYEWVRSAARWLGDRDPLVQRTARGTALALATTEDTARRLRALGATNVQLFCQVGMSREELSVPLRPRPAEPFRVVSVGRLLALKGFHLGLRAFAQARVAGAEYWILGDGPERVRLRRLAHDLGLMDRVRFMGELPRERVCEIFGQCHVLVQPALHESGGFVCSEAMAMGCPVIALDLGGSTLQVHPGTGVRIFAGNPRQAVADLAEAIAVLAGNQAMWQRYSIAAYEHVVAASGWSSKASALSDFYRRILDERNALRVEVPLC